MQEEMVKQISIMAFTYDLQTDIRYNQGISQGEEKKAVVAIQQMLVDNLSFDTIAKYLQVSLDFVKKVADSLKNK